MATYYSHWRHALLIHDGDFISTQTVSSAHQILYNDARFHRAPAAVRASAVQTLRRSGVAKMAAATAVRAISR